MKTCPTCGSVCFDDMDTCFDCLHRFDQESEPVIPIVPETPALITAEYSNVPPDCSEGTEVGQHCVTLHIKVPEGTGGFTIRCENLQIEGTAD